MPAPEVTLGDPPLPPPPPNPPSPSDRATPLPLVVDAEVPVEPDDGAVAAEENDPPVPPPPPTD